MASSVNPPLNGRILPSVDSRDGRVEARLVLDGWEVYRDAGETSITIDLPAIHDAGQRLDATPSTIIPGQSSVILLNYLYLRYDNIPYMYIIKSLNLPVFAIPSIHTNGR